MRYGSIDISSLQGETLSYVDQSDDQILLTTKSGRKIMIYHEQDCCESVRIEDTEGNWKDLIGRVLLYVGEDTDDVELDWGSGTKTTFTFKVDGDTVISRWIGESNGYYSEKVDIKELTND